MTEHGNPYTDHASTAGVLVVGESLIDIIPGNDGRQHRLPGGSTLNVAVGLGRLAEDVSLLTEIGTDEDSRLIEEHLHASRVGLHPATNRSGRTSTARAELGEDGAAHYDFDLRWTLTSHGVLQSTPPPAVLHVGSIGAVLEPGYAGVAELCRSLPTALVTFDPNIRVGLVPERDMKERIERLMSESDVVKLSDADAEVLFPGLDEGAIIDKILGIGPSLVAVTRGGDGATLATTRQRVASPAATAAVVDTIGAGDSFMAGLIHRLLHRRPKGLPRDAGTGLVEENDLVEVLDFAVRCAGITVTRPGADLPWLHEVDEDR
ncbi:carbohydrate kinase [Micrococcaceae bacterium RIT802]|nr:carbohydrate kinase [Micrococcaceae bacterium RIT 802]